MLSRVGVLFSVSALLRTWTRTQEMFRENLTVGCFPHPTPSLAHLARWQGSHGGHRPCAVSEWQGPGVARQAAASALPMAVLPRPTARPYAGLHPHLVIPVSCHVERYHCQKSPLCSPCYLSFSLSSWKPPKGFLFFYYLHSFAFSRISNSWNDMVYRLFRLAFSLSNNLSILHVILWLDGKFSFNFIFVVIKINHFKYFKSIVQ